MGADTASKTVTIPPVSIDVAQDTALAERRAWRRQVWVRTSLFFAVCGVIVGLVFVIGAFRLGVIDCFWDSVEYVIAKCQIYASLNRASQRNLERLPHAELEVARLAADRRRHQYSCCVCGRPTVVAPALRPDRLHE